MSTLKVRFALLVFVAQLLSGLVAAQIGDTRARTIAVESASRHPGAPSLPRADVARRIERPTSTDRTCLPPPDLALVIVAAWERAPVASVTSPRTSVVTTPRRARAPPVQG